MIRCKTCGKPVGVGKVLGGDIIRCKKHIIGTGKFRLDPKLIDWQMRESRQEKTSGKHRRYKRLDV